MLLLIPEIFHQKHIFRAQRVILLLVLFIPWMADIITEFKIGPDLPIDLTVFGFALMALALTFGLLRYQMLNPIPIARHRLMEFTNEAVIVVDNSKLVVDINHGAERLLNKTAKDILGKPLSWTFDKK